MSENALALGVSNFIANTFSLLGTEQASTTRQKSKVKSQKKEHLFYKLFTYFRWVGYFRRSVLGLQDAFDVLNSAETEEFGKPHPAVYLTTARRLGVAPNKCVAVEDSIRGMMSAKTAGMRCIVVPAAEERENPQFAAADIVLDSLEAIDRAWLERVINS